MDEKIVNFSDYIEEREEKEDTIQIGVPTKAEADFLRAYIEKVTEQDPEGMLDARIWDGSSWKTLFESLKEVAPEVDPWDALAIFIMKMNGAKFETDENGKVIKLSIR